MIPVILPGGLTGSYQAEAQSQGNGQGDAGRGGAGTGNAQVPAPAQSSPPGPPSAGAPGQPQVPAAVKSEIPTVSGTIQAIKVEGNQRIEAGTVLSYMLVKPGDPFDRERLDASLKTLFATGLFSDVKLRVDGRILVVSVVENPIVNKVVFEGNHKLTDDQLRNEIQLKPRSVFTPALAQADRQRMLDLYARRGRFDAHVEPKVIRLDQNRVDVVFEINEGATTLISRIAFVGNKAFSEGTLRDVINSREERFWRFLSNSDTYDPDRLNYDKELLRRFYLKQGYADVEVTDARAELAPDRSAFFITFTVNEGERYKFGKISIESHLRKLDAAELYPVIKMEEGDWYNGDLVERTQQALVTEVQNRGYAFVEVKPRVKRNTETHTIDLMFDIGEGPRVYVERIDIVGNSRTMDKVIRREFRVAEGDAYDAAAVRLTKQRLDDLGYFNKVDIQTSPGSTPDRAVLTTTIDEKATGELTLGGGYSTDSGFLVNAGLRERNLVGTGIDANLSGILAQRNSSVNFALTDPYFLDRNLVAGTDIFYINNNNLNIAEYEEQRAGFDIRVGYNFNENLRQAWTYSLVDRDVYNIATTASDFVKSQAGYTLLSQIGQTIAYDRRDSRLDPHDGYIVRIGTDFAGLGGDVNFFRAKIDGAYYIPLDRFTGDSDWTLGLSAGTGYFWNFNNVERIIDNFFLGGDNLRGFQVGGAGPHDAVTGDSLGGHFIWTQSTEVRFPLPVSPDLGLTGRVFADIGALSQVSSEYAPGKYAQVYDNPNPRVGAGVGVSWKTPFGLINIDIADPVVKYKFDQTQVFRFGFGTRF